MIEIGRVVMKIAGRDAGQIGLIIKILDEHNVLIDGEVRRRKCNINHLEFIAKVLKIKAEASSSEVRAALKTSGFDILEKKSVKKDVAPRPKKVRKIKVHEDKQLDVKKAPEEKTAGKKHAAAKKGEPKPVRKAPAEKPQVKPAAKKTASKPAPK